MELFTQNPEVMSGALCFAGTRVPVSALFDNLSDGATVTQFVEWFPGVSLSQAQAALHEAAREIMRQQAY